VPNPAWCVPVRVACQDPKTSRWLWNIRERARQKRRTENYRRIIAMQENKIAEINNNGY